MSQYITQFFKMLHPPSADLPMPAARSYPSDTSDRAKKKKRRACAFADDKAAHSGSGSDGGDADSSSGDDEPTAEDRAMIDDGEVTEDESLALPRLTRRERRLTKDDLRLVREARAEKLREGGVQRRRVLADDSDDSGDFVVSDGDEEEPEEVQEFSRRLSEIRKGSGVAEKGRYLAGCSRGVLKISPDLPFGLRDPGSGKVVHGTTGAAFVPMERPEKVPKRPGVPGFLAEARRKEEEERIRRRTKDALDGTPAFKRKFCPSLDDNDMPNFRTHGSLPWSAPSKRHLPEEHCLSKLAPVFVPGGAQQPSPSQAQPGGAAGSFFGKAGVFRKKDGQMVRRDRNGVETPVD